MPTRHNKYPLPPFLFSIPTLIYHKLEIVYRLSDYFSSEYLLPVCCYRHRWRIVWKCGCRSTHFAVVHPQKWMEHPWRTTNTVSEVRHGCFINLCGCTTAKWVLRHPHFHTILHLWLPFPTVLKGISTYLCLSCFYVAAVTNLMTVRSKLCPGHSGTLDREVWCLQQLSTRSIPDPELYQIPELSTRSRRR